MSIPKGLRKTIYRLLSRKTASFLHRSYHRAKIHFTKELTAEEITLIDSISCLVEKDAAVVDIGAHFGAWTIRLSHLVGPNGIVVAFEPIPGNYKILTKRAKRQGNILCLNIALSNKSGYKEMVLPEYSSLSSTAAIVDTADQVNNVKHIQKIKIRTDRLDDIDASVLSDKQISLIKCDVEGHENAILEGSRSTIIKNRPVIVLEILREKWENDNSSKSQVAHFLTELGYKIVQIESGEILEDPALFNRSQENFLFLPDDDSLVSLTDHINQ